MYLFLWVCAQGYFSPPVSTVFKDHWEVSTISLLLSFQTSHVGTRRPSLTSSCTAILASKWGMSCCMFVLRGTSWATRKRHSRCSATLAGSGMGRFRPVSKVSLARGAPLWLVTASHQPSQGGFRLHGMSPGSIVPVKVLVTIASKSCWPNGSFRMLFIDIVINHSRWQLTHTWICRKFLFG